MKAFQDFSLRSKMTVAAQVRKRCHSERSEESSGDAFAETITRLSWRLRFLPSVQMTGGAPNSRVIPSVARNLKRRAEATSVSE